MLLGIEPRKTRQTWLGERLTRVEPAASRRLDDNADWPETQPACYPSDEPAAQRHAPHATAITCRAERIARS